ncbi:unnamed protein product [Callosobruchus maculatus]|uniref:Uncharacterized protein n=1 Tax=Callosobruchus maculatus TaxID=64391 RepID=A0A653BTX9_CALMS|nr:unnamed protein product [Callosobruchus maculatus]
MQIEVWSVFGVFSFSLSIFLFSVFSSVLFISFCEKMSYSN